MAIRWIWGLLAVVSLLAGCGGAASQPTPVAEETTAAPPPMLTLPPVDPAEVTGAIFSGGSATVFPLARRMAEEFEAEGFTSQIIIDPIGTSGGFKRFCNTPEIDIVYAARPISTEERAECQEYGRDPLAFRLGTDAIVVVVSTDNEFVHDVTVDELTELFSIAETWQDVRPEWPPEPIRRYPPETESASFDFFIDTVFAGDPEPLLNASYLPLTADDNVLVQGVAKDPYAIGFLGYAYATQHSDHLRLIALNGTMPTVQTIAAGNYLLAQPLYIYADAGTMQRKPQVAAFLNYVLTSVNDMIGDVGYVPASPEALNQARQTWLDAMSAESSTAAPTTLPTLQPTHESATPIPRVMSPTHPEYTPTSTVHAWPRVAMLDAQHIWFVTPPPDQYHLEGPFSLFVTTDGGQFWEERMVTDAAVEQLQVVSPLDGFAVMDDTLHTTHDGGATWQPVRLLTMYPTAHL